MTSSFRQVSLGLLGWVLLLPAASGAQTSPDQPHPAVTLVKGKEFAPKGDFVVGYRFSVTSPVVVSSLGLIDKDADGILKGAHPLQIGLWDSDRRQVASAELPLNTKARDGAFYVPIKPLNLTQGTYVIAYASPEDGERYWFSADVKTAPEIRWEQGLYAGGAQLTCPTEQAPGTCYFGPTMLISAGGTDAASNQAAAEMSILQPLDRAIVQRDANNSAAVSVVCSLTKPAATVEAKAVTISTGKDASSWVKLSPAAPTSFSGKLQLPAGWYKLEIRALGDGKPMANTTVDHVGVGEVFLTCGQSNSCNHGQPRQSPQDDRVSACNWESGVWSKAVDPQPGAEGDGGSPWPLLGDLLAKEYDVPVGFISVGVGATSVEQWLPGTDLYRHIKVGLGRMGPHGVRAVLWHQGEEDSVRGMPADEYARSLGLIIARSRRDAGYDVPWGIALVSYHPSAPADKQAPVLEGHKLVLAHEPAVFVGPDTDAFHLKDYMADGVHFNAKGLAAHAAGWADALRPLLGKSATKSSGAREANQPKD